MIRRASSCLPVLTLLAACSGGSGPVLATDGRGSGDAPAPGASAAPGAAVDAGTVPDAATDVDASRMGPVVGTDAGGTAVAGAFQLFLGQDTATLVQAAAGLAPLVPSGVTLYTNLANVDPSATNPYRVLGGVPRTSADVYTDQGDANPVDVGAGEVDFKATTSAFPAASLAVGLYVSDSSSGCTNQPLRAIVGRTAADTITGQSNTDITPTLEGQYGYYLKQLAGYFASLGKRTVLLRIGYEFDGLWNCYDPPLYTAAFRTIASAMHATAPNVKIVWQSAAWARPQDAGSYSGTYDFRFNGTGALLAVTDPQFGQPHLARWYPGDDVVDLVGLSYFYGETWMTQWGTDGGGAMYPPPAAQEAVMTFAKGHGKQVFIAESTPQGFDLTGLTVGTIFNGPRAAVTADAIWTTWFAPYFAFIGQHRDAIEGASYIDANWQSQSQWACAPGASVGAAGCASGWWGDTRVEANAEVKAKFVAAVQGLQ